MFDGSGAESGIVAPRKGARSAREAAQGGAERRANPESLRIEVLWDSSRVVAPAPSALPPPDTAPLVGRTVEEALDLVHRLDGAAPRIHEIAATAAFAAAGAPHVVRREPWAEERMIAIETAQEHLSRLMLDWPVLFGHEPRRERFDMLFRQLAQSGGSRGPFRLGGDLLDLVAVELLGGFFQATREPSALREFVERARRGGTIGAALADLIEMGPSVSEQDSVPLLPVLSAEAWGRELGAVPSAHFCAAPSLYGRAFETGVLGRHADSMLVRILLGSGHRIAARLFARVIDLADCASRLRHPLAGDMPLLIDAAPLGDGAGLAWIETAQGLLMHALRLDDGRVAEYAVVTPRQWNFHPHGAFAAEGTGWAAPSREVAALRLDALVLALDPGQQFEIVLKDTAGA